MDRWYDFFKLFDRSFTPDPLTAKADREDLDGVAVADGGAVQNIRGDDPYGSSSTPAYDANALLDVNSVESRQARYREYERLRSVPEIEMCMSVFADESCIDGDTKIVTPFGSHTIKWLAENRKDEKFLVYSFDTVAEDYTLAWAFAPRLTGKKMTVRVILDNGSEFICTSDHRILLRSGKWKEAGELKFSDELMPFYKLQPNQYLAKSKVNQFPRIFTHNQGWTHERMFADTWRIGKSTPEKDRVQKAIRLISQGLTCRQIQELMGHQWKTIETWVHKAGFSFKEIKQLAKNPDKRRVIGVESWKEVDVYDLSVEKHHCFCGEDVVFHNCQTDESGHVCKVEVDNHDVKEEVEYALFNLWNIDDKLWNDAKNLFIFGDRFWELCILPESPKDGILRIKPLPAESMFRIETVRGRLVEFQQGKDKPDLTVVNKNMDFDTERNVRNQPVMRFTPEQIIHMKIGEDRKTFYPYGVSLIEAARGAANMLRMMEDAMLVYRLTRAPERRVFYIDIGQVAPHRAEAFMERLKDQFKKRKTGARGGLPGASSVEERWHAPSADEDYWIPLRPNSGTRVETLPGAQNLGEIDDALYFRNKLFNALNFPKNYFNQEDVTQTRVTLSAQDVKFARMIERLQSSMEKGLTELVKRHLTLKGYPEESFDDLTIKITPPSDWRELSRTEVITTRINNASSLKGSQLLADFDILTKWMKYSEEEAMEMIARVKIQKYEDLKMQIIAQNPSLLGAGLPGEGETEIGTQAGGPTPDLDPSGGGGAAGGDQPPPDPSAGDPSAAGGGDPSQAQQPTGQAESQGPQAGSNTNDSASSSGSGAPLPDVTPEDLKKYDLEIQDYSANQDDEDIDYSEE